MMFRPYVAPLVAALAFLVGGCSNEPAVEEAPAAENVVMAASSHGASPSAPRMVTGTVLETMDAAGYTYVRVDTGEAEIWAASNRFAVAAGDRVTLPLETPMEGFHSASLDRDFDRIYFASFIVPEGEMPSAPAQAAGAELPPGHPSLEAFAIDSGAAAAGPVGAPAGGMTIAELWQRKADLAGKTVTVRGRVVKYNGAILGRNWLHLQDGSGELAEGTNDITVTTSTEAAVGDVITATGTVAVDRDFGSGYTYTVMLEDATIVP